MNNKRKRKRFQVRNEMVLAKALTVGTNLRETEVLDCRRLANLNVGNEKKGKRRRIFSLFWWDEFARQVLYHLSHTLKTYNFSNAAKLQKNIKYELDKIGGKQGISKQQYRWPHQEENRQTLTIR
jgi:hypothetical protein